MEPLNILVFDTSKSCLRIALSSGGKDYFVDAEGDFKHVENLIPEIDKCLKNAGAVKKDLNFVGVCSGPGSFTGIRIGISAALGISYGLNIQAFGFSTFDIYKFLLKDRINEVVIPIIDAKKSKFYCAFIENDKPFEMLDIGLSEIKEIISGKNKKIIFTGKDFKLIKDKIDFSNYEYLFPENYSSKNMLDYSKHILKSKNGIVVPDPIYLRKSEAEILLINSNIAK